MRLVALLVLVLALVSRAWGVGEPGLWHDEVASVRYAHASPGDVFRAAGSLDPHPPFYYWVLHGTVRACGDGEAALRAPSVLFGVLTIALVLWSRRFSAAAVLAAVLLTLNPEHLLYSREVRSYALLLFVTLAGSIAVVRCVRARTVTAGALAVWAVAAVVGFWTHFLAALVIAVQGLLLLWAATRSERPAAAWRRITLASGLVAATCLPLVVAVKQTVREGIWFLKPPGASALFDLPAYLLAGLEPWCPVLVALAAWALALARVLAPRAGASEKPDADADEALAWTVLWVGPAVLNFAVSWAVTPVWYPRQLLYGLPPLVLAMSAGPPCRLDRSLRYGLTALALVAALAGLRHVDESWKSTARTAAERLLERAPQKLAVFVWPDWQAKTVLFYVERLAAQRGVAVPTVKGSRGHTADLEQPPEPAGATVRWVYLSDPARDTSWTERQLPAARRRTTGSLGALPIEELVTEPAATR